MTFLLALTNLSFQSKKVQTDYFVINSDPLMGSYSTAMTSHMKESRFFLFLIFTCSLIPEVVLIIPDGANATEGMIKTSEGFLLQVELKNKKKKRDS